VFSAAAQTADVESRSTAQQAGGARGTPVRPAAVGDVGVRGGGGGGTRPTVFFFFRSSRATQYVF